MSRKPRHGVPRPDLTKKQRKVIAKAGPKVVTLFQEGEDSMVLFSGHRVRRPQVPADKDTSCIPEGDYCYTYSKDGNHKVCPYWSLVKPGCPGVGHCSFLGMSDEDPSLDFIDDKTGERIGGGLLWDQVKECGINPRKR